MLARGWRICRVGVIPQARCYPAGVAVNIALERVEVLSEFYITTEDFEEELVACGRELAEWRGANHIQRHRMADLGQDMLGFREGFARAHINAAMWVLDDANEAARGFTEPRPKWEDFWAYFSAETDLPADAKRAVESHIEAGRQQVARMVRRQKSRAGIQSQESARELKAAYKAYFFFIRAFHDACYGVLLNQSGATPGAYSSMRKCIDKQVQPIFGKITAIPGYTDWFRSFKSKRDQIKLGANFSLCGPQWDVGVGFNRITAEGGVVVNAGPDGSNFRLGDLVAAFRYSTALLKVIRRDVPRSNSSLNTDASNAGAG